ncbi:MAG: hypothetical protein GEV03_04395 [Streptosporangiales bacterium]|nr:hypothetical protein [Streptosporangiales bacterium]
MRIPAREEFSPLPEVIDMLGLPDPLQVLPQLENQLEAVGLSNAQVGEIAAGFRGVADDLDAEAGGVKWQGAAADGFRSKIADMAQSLREAADNIDIAVAEVASLAVDAKKILGEILKAIFIVAGIIVAIYAIIIAAKTAAIIVAVIGLIGALALAIYTYLDLYLWLNQKAFELIVGLIRWIGEHPPQAPSYPTPHGPTP